MQDFVAIDFETANAQRSSICSVGVVIVKNGKPVQKGYSLIKPVPDRYDARNIEVHGIRPSQTKTAPSFPEVWKKLTPYIGDLPLVAHNKSFDESCLKKVFEVYGMEYPFYDFYCTLKAAKEAFPKLPNHKLPTVAREVGYILEDHHNAIADAMACAHIAIKIL